MKKKMKWVIAGVAAVGILSAFFCGFQRINASYPPAEEIEVPLGETAEFQKGVLITVRAGRILPGEEKTDAVDLISGPITAMILKADITLENTTDQIQEVELYNLNAETLGGSNGMHDAVVEGGDTNEIAFHRLQPGEVRKITIRYQILSNQFTKKDWKKIEERKFCLTYALYPEKRMLML